MNLIDMTETEVFAARIFKSQKKVNRKKAVNLLELFIITSVSQILLVHFDHKLAKHIVANTLENPRLNKPA